MTATTNSPKIPPRWFVRTAWVVHRAIYRVTGGRKGLWRPAPGKWGALRLTVTGRRSGQVRSVILGYIDDDAGYVTLAMNGWGEGEPAWWLNLQANPDATVDLGKQIVRVRGSAAAGAERERLWTRWRELGGDLDEHAKLRSTETAVVVLAPRVLHSAT